MPLASIIAHWMSGVWPDAAAPVVPPVYGTACAILYVSGASGNLKPAGASGSIKTPADC